MQLARGVRLLLLGWGVVIAVITAATIAVLMVGKRCGTLPQTTAALALQVSLSLTFFAAWGLSGDASTYHEAAKRLVESIEDGGTAQYTLPPGKRTTVAIAGAFYWLTGTQPVLYLLFMAAVTAFMPTLLAAATTLFGFRRAASIAAWLGVVAPPFILWTPWLTREALAFVFLGCSLVFFGLLYDRRWGITTAILFLFTIWGFWQTRPQLLLVLATGTVSALLFSKRKTPPSDLSQRSRERSKRIAASVFFGGLAVFAALTTFVESPSGRVVTDNSFRTAVQLEVSEAASLGIRYQTDDSIEPGGAAVLVTMPSFLEIPSRLVLSMVGPPPWQWKSTSLLLAGLDGLMMLMVWFLIIFQFVRDRSIRALTLITTLASLPLIAGEAYAHANYGISIRIRAHYLVLLLPVIAIDAQRLLGQVIERSLTWKSAAKEKPSGVTA